MFMCLLFKTLYPHYTCSYQLKLCQDCVRHASIGSLNMILCYIVLNSKDKEFLIIGT